jgi:dual specificity MAP kinase phosphatase
LLITYLHLENYTDKSRCSCFVRARRLNVIIQPHLRFVYELLKWDEYLQKKRREPIKRELEWATVAREIAAMNKPYSRA